MRKIKNNNNALWGILVIIFIVALIILSAVLINSAWVTQYTIKGTVVEKWIDYGDEESYYLLRIKTLNNKTKMLEVNRNVLHGSSYNPDIVYSDIKVNKTYKFTCWGWQYQWAWIYWYPCVIIAKE